MYERSYENSDRYLQFTNKDVALSIKSDTSVSGSIAGHSSFFRQESKSEHNITLCVMDHAMEVTMSTQLGLTSFDALVKLGDSIDKAVNCMFEERGTDIELSFEFMSENNRVSTYVNTFFICEGEVVMDIFGVSKILSTLSMFNGVTQVDSNNELGKMRVALTCSSDSLRLRLIPERKNLINFMRSRM